MRFLADVSAALDASLDMERTLAAVAELCVRDLGDWCSIDLTDADGELRNVAVAHVDPAQAELAQRMRERYPPRSRAGGGTAQVVRTGEPLLLARISEEQMVAGARDAEHLELIRSLGLTSVLMVALRARGHVLGAITLARTGRHPSYDEDDVAFVGEVAGRAALALDNARLYGEARARERDSSEAQALLDALVNAAPIGQGFLDTDFRYVRVNDALAEINGVPAIDHIGRTVREVLPALAADIEAALEEVLARARRSSTCRSWARRGASPAASATTSRATTRWASSAARINDETPIAESEPQSRTPMLLPKIADVAARRPSRPATRNIAAVPGPGVIVTTSATAGNSHGERNERKPTQPAMPAMSTWEGWLRFESPAAASRVTSVGVNATGSAGPHVRLTSGSVRGRTEDGLAVFRGMPFARPPVGELRLAAPMPVEPWEGVREAVAFGPPPPQSG